MSGAMANGSKEKRLIIFGGILCLAFIGLIVRLWYVQVRQHGDLQERSAGQSVRRIRTLPNRGSILAEDGSVLVNNRVSYDLVFHVSEMRRPGVRANTVAHILDWGEKLADLLNRDVPFGESYVERRLNVYPALPMNVFTDLSSAELARIVELVSPPRGLEIAHSLRRNYPHSRVGTHILGFCGRTKPNVESEADVFSYAPLELRGRQGLERRYDQELSGSGGMKTVRVDTLGYVYEEIGEGYAPIDGMNLGLTIDLEAQKTADSLLRGKKGAIAVLDVERGGVVAMASSPDYELADLTSGKYARLARQEERRPLVNRAIYGRYLPGSIIKPLIALAALESGSLEEEEEYYCTGAYRLTPSARPIRCWNRGGHGALNIVEAIQHSCNPFFNHYGVETGLAEIRPLLESAGIGREPGIDLPGSGSSGLVPSREWARRRMQREWLAIDTAFISIGQGSVLLSPLQAAMFTVAIANGGILFKPYLVQEIIGPEGVRRQNTAPVPLGRLPVSPGNLDLVREGMIRAVNRSRGTARQARNSAVELAGKTGTAQVQRPDEDDYNDTWFIGYGPVDNPRWAIAILIEDGDSGGSTAAPLAREFFTRWRQATKEDKD